MRENVNRGELIGRLVKTDKIFLKRILKIYIKLILRWFVLTPVL